MGSVSSLSHPTAPQLDWDPDIVDALKTAEATSDPQEELEDDFILLVLFLSLLPWSLCLSSLYAGK